MHRLRSLTATLIMLTVAIMPTMLMAQPPYTIYLPLVFQPDFPILVRGVKQAAVPGTTPLGPHDLYLMLPTPHQASIQLTHDAEATSPTCSPDGQWIAFSMEQQNRRGIHLIHWDGTAQRRLTTYGGQPTWSPDSKQIAFVSAQVGKEGLYVMGLDGTHMRRLVAGKLGAPQWSPDGSRIIFVTRDETSTHVKVVNSDGTGIRVLVSEPVYFYPWPAWSPTGSEIAFLSLRAGPSAVYTMQPDGSNQTRLTTNSERETEVAWSPDGSHLAISTKAGVEDRLLIVRRDGSPVRSISVLSDFGFGQMAWSPDGSHILYIAFMYRIGVLRIVEAATGRGVAGIYKQSIATVKNALWAPSNTLIPASPSAPSHAE